MPTKSKSPPSAAVEKASRPTIEVQTATASAVGADRSESDLARIQIEKLARAAAERPSGRRWCARSRRDGRGGS